MSGGMARIRDRIGGLAFGGDYNPEQWPEEVLDEDIELMQHAGVNLVSVGIFGWAHLEPVPDRYEFGWLDRILDRLADAGIGVDLATATASAPAWLSRRHPEVLPVARDGRRWSFGGRQAWCPSSPVYRDRSVRLVEQLAVRYADHPALVMWHVSNELGCHNAHCYCDVSADAFRRWLGERYGDIDALNQAWGTAFWSQRYTDFEEVLPPREVTAIANPTQVLDFYRFSSDELFEQFRAERAVLRRHTPDVPVTTNLMGLFGKADYWRWAPEQDLISNDHYLQAHDPDAHIDLALNADVVRGLGGGEPWLLMEHSTSAVNWQPRNRAKRPGEMLRNSLQHVARGSDGAMFFQWRASKAGAEKYHSGMVPHAGPDSRVHREVVELGAILRRLAEIGGSRVEAEVALVVDWPSWWAVEFEPRPSIDVTYLDRLRALHAALWRAGVTADVVAGGADLSGYRLAVVPTLHVVDDAGADAIERFVRAGGTALITYLSGTVDRHDHVHLGGYPGAFRELLGIRVEEFFPLGAGEHVKLDNGYRADVWTELLHLDGAEVVACYRDGDLSGVPAITRNEHGGGVAWYVATRLDPAGDDQLVARILREAGVGPAVDAPTGVEVVRRVHDDGACYLFVLNHTDEVAEVVTSGTELIEGTTADGSCRVLPGGMAVVRQE